MIGKAIAVAAIMAALSGGVAFAQEATPASTPVLLEPGHLMEQRVPILNSELTVVSYYLIDTDDGVVVYGEVENSSDRALVPGPFRAQGYDENGQRYGEEAFIGFNLPALAPDDRVNFSGDLTENLSADDLAGVRFFLGQYDDIESELVPPLEVRGIPEEGQLAEQANADAEVVNAGSSAIDVQIVVSLFDGDGRPLGTMTISMGALPGGKSFEFTLADDDWYFSAPREAIDALGLDNIGDGAYRVHFRAEE